MANSEVEVGINDRDQVTINYPNAQVDENGMGNISFTPDQARHLALLLIQSAELAERQAEAKKPAPEPPPPVDYTARTMTDGSPETPDHREINPATGMQKGYIVLSPEERRKGFVRPVRTSYRHNKCGTVTTMGLALAETYARAPDFYQGTMCVNCRAHFPLAEFVWDGTLEQVGS